jgi:hypothetical protein
MTRPAFAFYAAISGSAARFRSLLPRAQEIQCRRLLTLLRHNASSEFGRRHGFASIRDADDYRARVPVSTYETLQPQIERMQRGEPGVLVADEVVAWERTGGSTGGAKAIPYPEAALEAFRRAVLPWIDDLATTYPRLTTGRAYWSISPGGGNCGAAYFGAELAPLMLETLAVGPEIGALEDVDEWREATRRQLAACSDLALVSVWSPTFLSGLIDDGLSWPELKVISCWDQGSSRPHADALRARFPAVRVQGKGLLATEGAVTIPLEDLPMPVLAVDSGFFEFLDAGARFYFAWELKAGGEYELLMTTEGGLYRYAIGDRVRVHGFAGEAPLLEFVGRGAHVSDLCGEKLSEDFVLGALEPLGLRFAMVAPAQAGYVLVVDAAEVTPERTSVLAASAEAGLCRNPQYAYARRLRQLGELEVVRRERPLEAWLQARLKRGQRLGDIKPPALCIEPGWAP